MGRAADRVRILEEIVSAPSYAVVGFTHGRLAYTSNEGGVLDLWSMEPDAGKPLRLTSGGVHIVAPPRSSSPLVVFTRDVSRGRELQGVFAVDVRGGEELGVEGFEPRRVLGIAFDGRRAAFAAAGERAVELWLAEPGGEAEKLHEVEAVMYVTDYADGLIVGQGVLKGNPTAFELFIYDVGTGEFEVYTPRDGSTNRRPRVRGSSVLFATTAFGGEKLMIYDAESGELREPELTHSDHEKYEFTEYPSFGWTDDGRIWFVGKRDGRTRVFLDGSEVPTPPGFVSGVAVAGERVYVSHSSLASPPAIYEVFKGSAKRILGAELSRAVASRIGPTRLVRYKSSDGLEVPAYVVESRAAPRPGPTVVYVHGGPWSEVADSWNVFIAALAAAGYHVVAPNFRGSTGYGEEFRRLDVGDPGGGDLEDVVRAAEWARESGLASRVAIMGYSYGGFMTFIATVKRPEVWDAGVAGAGIVDWEEMYGLSDSFFRKFIEVLFGGRRELWRERSAIHYVERLRAPICILHPQNDSRTPLRPVLRYVQKLVEEGKTFELHVIPDAGHAIRRIEDALKLLLPAVLFLDRYLGA